MKSWVTVPKFKCEYFKLLNGENFTSTWIALQRPYTLIISREKNFIREFWVLSHTAGLQAVLTIRCYLRPVDRVIARKVTRLHETRP